MCICSRINLILALFLVKHIKTTFPLTAYIADVDDLVFRMRPFQPTGHLCTC